MTTDYDAIVIGGGLLGAAIGFGLARLGEKTLILDQGDVAFRAARGNFGLIWVQGKGSGAPAYADWTERSAEAWPALAEELTALTGASLQISQRGGLHVCLSEAEMAERGDLLATLARHQGGRFHYEMLGRNALAALLPGIGPEVVGGSFSPHDGHVNPLALLRAMHEAFAKLGGRIETGRTVTAIRRHRSGFEVACADARHRGQRVVLAAGLGNAELAPMVGLVQPVRPVKGQVLVTERVAPFLDLPTSQVRQTGDGTVMIGDSQEEAGFDTRSTPGVIKTIAERARRMFPALGRMQVVRTWAALRVMTPDGLPVYDQSEVMPGAFAVSCHSGVTLAAAHALELARDISAGTLSERVAQLSSRRLDVQAP